MKHLSDKEAFSLIEPMIKKGTPYFDIALELGRAGYTTKNGRKFDQSAISRICLLNGFRKKHFATKPQIVNSPAPQQSGSKLIADIQAILATNIADSLKERLVRTLLSDVPQ